MGVVLIFGIILVISALSAKTTNKIGMPLLVGFIAIGVLLGNWYSFENTTTVDNICEFALLLIIFTGAFQTNYHEAKPVLAMSSVLSIGGMLLTAALGAAFAYFALKIDFYPALLLGAVLSSTDVESVFSVLRSRHMDLKNNLNAVLEIESSNDPFAHMLTTLLIVLATTGSAYPVIMVVLYEILIGVICGVGFAKLGQWAINKLNVDIDSLYGVMLGGIAFLAYGIAAQIHGNGFLAVYICGIILGNSKLMYKGSLSRLFSAISMLMQVMLFIMLGILCVPASVMAVMSSGLLFAAFLFLIARPLVIFALMKPFGRPLNEIALVSWAGFRGAPSIAFTTHLVTMGLPYAEYIFSMVFFVCMLSVIVQGTFMVPIAKKLKLVDDD